MSRSYKKTPGYTCSYRSKSRKIFKRCSNKQNRRNIELSDGAEYKKNRYTYDICDYKFLSFTRRDLINWDEISEKWPCFKELNNREYKHKRK